jgi:predicted phage tail protein
MTDKIIRGSGGPPPTPPSPTRAPDTLNSRQFATIQDLLSEGEIEGFATPSKAGLTKGTTAYNNAALKDIFLNDTPILNSSASNTNPQM